MTKRKFYDPYIELIDRFNRKGIKYVVVGMSGINYYASRAEETFATQDFDIFVKPTISNLSKSIAVFKELRYNLISNKQKVDDSSIKDIVKQKKTILATNSYGITFKLMLTDSGYIFPQMQMDVTIFNVERIPVKVARLDKLLTSKKIAGSEKDKLFLKRFEILLKEKINKEK